MTRQKLHVGFLPCMMIGIPVSSFVSIVVNNIFPDTWAFVAGYATTISLFLAAAVIYRIYNRSSYKKYLENLSKYSVTVSSGDARGEVSLPCPREDAARRVKEAFIDAKFAIFDGYSGGALMYKRRMSFRTWGNVISVVVDGHDSSSSIAISSKPRLVTTMTDYDQGKMDIVKLFELICER